MAEINYEELGRAIAEQIKNALKTVNAPSHNEEKETKVDYLVYDRVLKLEEIDELISKLKKENK